LDSWVFEVADYDSIDKILKNRYKSAQNDSLKISIVEIWYPWVFEAADFKSVNKIYEFYVKQPKLKGLEPSR